MSADDTYALMSVISLFYFMSSFAQFSSHFLAMPFLCVGSYKLVVVVSHRVRACICLCVCVRFRFFFSCYCC